MYNPLDHYWLADDGRVYGSAKQIITDEGDPDYIAWRESFTPTRWPVDDVGEQTDASLQAVVGPMGQFVNLKYYAADKRWRTEQGGIVTRAGFPIKTDDRAQAKITGTYTAQKEVPTVSTPWHTADGGIVDLDATGLYDMHVDLLTHINNCFAVSADVLTDIDAGTITTREQVDAAFEAPMSRERRDWMKT